MEDLKPIPINFIAYHDDLVIPISIQSNQLLEDLKMNLFSFIENAEFNDLKLILESYGDLENYYELPLSCLDLSIFI